jgi:hypothetical protein
MRYMPVLYLRSCVNVIEITIWVTAHAGNILNILWVDEPNLSRSLLDIVVILEFGNYFKQRTDYEFLACLRPNLEFWFCYLTETLKEMHSCHKH